MLLIKLSNQCYLPQTYQHIEESQQNTNTSGHFQKLILSFPSNYLRIEWHLL